MKSLMNLVVLVMTTGFLVQAAQGEIELVRKVEVDGRQVDKSGETGELSDGTPANRLGGPSGLTWTGRGHEYLWLSDRGPKDGATIHAPRLHEVELAGSLIDGRAPELKRTVVLKNGRGEPLSGSAENMKVDERGMAMRFDPEGIAVWEGKWVISDEYGPKIRVFDKVGRGELDWPVPDRFEVERPSADEKRELAENMKGRLPNAGFEGLCVDGQGGLLASLQRPLIQDGAYGAEGQRVGRNVRLLNMCGPNCRPREFVYVLDDAKNGLSELCHVGGTVFLAIERDGKPGLEAVTKKIMLFDIAGATDVSEVESLPSTGMPEGVKPVRKRMLMDLLDKRYGLAGKEFPEKIEGLTFGPALADGRRLLVVASDNDFEGEEPIRIWFFAVPVKDLE